MLFSWGANTYGQLGLGTKCEEVRNPNKVEFIPEELLLSNIKSIEVGGNQSFLILNDGSVYGCGLNNVGQLGFVNLEEHKFVKLTSLSKYKISQISCKWDTCYAITNDNVCIGWGANLYRQLGLPPNQLNQTKDAIIICENAKQIAAGLRHCAVLLVNGKVMTAGTGKRGQLGRSVEKGSCKFDIVKDLDNIIMIASGQNFTLALTEDKKLFGWGCNKFSQLGHKPENYPFTEKPVHIDISATLSKEIIQNDIILKCGWTHCLLHVGNKLFTWGRNNYGQLGNTNLKVPYSDSLIEVLNDEDIHAVAVGAEHNLIITGDGQLKTWGWNEHGSCGDNSNSSAVIHPCFINMTSKPKIIGAGSGHSFCLLH